MAGKYVLSTLGCKVNQYESQQIRDLVESLGFKPASPDEIPHIAVVNTCAVTAQATQRNLHEVRRIRRNAATDVFVVGCGASADSERLRKLGGVAAVIGHDADICAELRKLLQARLDYADYASEGAAWKANAAPQSLGELRELGGISGWIRPALAGADAKSASPTARRSAPPARVPFSPQAIISAPLNVVKTSETLVGRIESFDGHQRAFLKVQDGCDAHCTYCIIPQLRPTLRSKPLQAAVQEARALVGAGHKEIVVTGIFLGAYGRPTAIRRRFSSARAPFVELVDALSRVEGLCRLRLSSLEPGDVDQDLLDVLASRPTCVPHLHLPLQSGSAEILRRMNRQYGVNDFIAMIDRVRATLDEPAISTDIIVGFPGETESDFEQTVEMARYAGFCKMHVFPFSPRERTAAARWAREFVTPSIVKQRMAMLSELERELSLAYRSRLLGRDERVIVEPGAAGRNTPVSPADLVRHEDEAEGYANSRNIHAGRGDRYVRVHFESAASIRAGDLVYVRINRVTADRTHGTALWPRAGVTSLPQLP